MIELPEAQTLARQLNDTITGRTITSAVAGASPHGFAWYNGDPAGYGDFFTDRKISGTAASGGRVEIIMGDVRLVLNDGVNARYLAAGDKRPAKHQLLIELNDGCAICGTVQMYGGIMAYHDGEDTGPYAAAAREKPSPLTDVFDAAYFASILTDVARKLSAKAFLATEQRIPGLGNGVLQDILWRAGIHPKRKMNTLSDTEFETMFVTVKDTLAEMTEKGGRDTEKDLFGKPGGYITVLSRKNVGMPCPECGGIINRMAYLGGNVYVCGGCQQM